MAAIALAQAAVPLRGDLLVGLGSGGMPVSRSPVPEATRANVGQGNGCSFMLEQGVRPDFAVIAKPGTAVAYEEVGLCWFKIVVRGGLDYSGRASALGRPANYRNPILDAMTVIAGLEAWLPEYTARNTSGLVAPRGNVSAIEAGWPDRLAFIPAACNVYLDIRISPRTEPTELLRLLEAELARIQAANPQLELSCEMILAIPGTSTAADNWIVRSTVNAWERENAAAHVWATGTSGATDANILRARGIPTARIGFPRLPANAPHNDVFSMGVANVPDMVRLTRSLIAIAIDTCTRSRDEVGL
jgi:acetylornithine deacetylase/succinyl-diaminopimelate desuccinylase-like protein